MKKNNLSRVPVADRHHLFKCHFPGCNASYRRKEHLHRHEGKHSQQPDFACPNCGSRFGRSDTLRRHLQRHHKINEPLNRAQRACESCHMRKSRCEGGPPCKECQRRKIPCSFGSLEAHSTEIADVRAATSTHNRPHPYYSDSQEQYIEIYFETVHSHWPFIHRGSFDTKNETPLLVQAMTVMGLWATGKPTARSAAMELHQKIDLAIRDQRTKWDASEVEDACSTCIWPIPTYQAILLHILFSLSLKGGDTLDFSLRILPSSDDFGLLEALVRSCRKLGMFYYPNILSKFPGPNPASFVWVGIEEIKRLNLALYKVCGRLSSPRIEAASLGSNNAGNMLLTTSELQFPLPHNCKLWNAIGKKEWMEAVEHYKTGAMDDGEANWISNFAEGLCFLET